MLYFISLSNDIRLNYACLSGALLNFSVKKAFRTRKTIAMIMSTARNHSKKVEGMNPLESEADDALAERPLFAPDPLNVPVFGGVVGVVEVVVCVVVVDGVV